MFDWKVAADEFPAALFIVNQYGNVVYINKILSERGKVTLRERARSLTNFTRLKIIQNS